MSRTAFLNYVTRTNPPRVWVDQAIRQLELPPKEQRTEQDYARLLVYLAPPIGTPVMTHRGKGIICDPPKPLQDGRITYAPGANGNVWVQLPGKQPDLYLINRLTILENDHDAQT